MFSARSNPLVPSWELALMGPEVVEEHLAQAQAVFSLMRAGIWPNDPSFDQIYPSVLKKLSKIHWTPVSVAKRAAELLVQAPGTRVLDVGSGCGKFCLIGALTTAGSFTGVEQRGYLTAFSNHLVRRHGIPGVSYQHGSAFDLDWDSFDAFYFFNPFYEHIASLFERISSLGRVDALLSVSEERYARSVEAARGKLKALRVGTRVVTYHGFGGSFPSSFKRLLCEPQGSDALELWVKESI